MDTVHSQDGLKDFALIDKKRSTMDTKRSDPERGLYFFKEGEKERFKIRTGSNKLAPYWYHWIKNDPVRINSVMIRKGYDFVTRDDDVVPEGVHLNAEGKYQFGDLVLMKCDLGDFLRRKKDIRIRADAGILATLNKFRLEQSKAGAGLEKEVLDGIVNDLAASIK